MEKNFIEVSRKWHNPQVHINVGIDGMWEKMGLEDFKKAIVREIGSVRWIAKQDTFEKQVDQAFENVIREIMGLTRSVAQHIPVDR